MNTSASNVLTPYQTGPATPPPERRQVDRLLSQLDEITERSVQLMRKPFGQIEHSGQYYELPRYVFLGPRGGGDIARIGIFATIHGDEPEGALALSRLAALLEKDPEPAQGYCLFLYPICNPTGFEDNTRHSRSGRDLNREFWKESAEPEVRLLESEIWTHAFDGIITLHADESSDGMYGYVSGAVLSENLLEPALRESGKFIRRNRRREIDGFRARNGIISDSFPGVLRAPGQIARPPFEITLETPQRAPLHLQVEALATALRTILVEYRCLRAIAQNI
jgi:hypothetical protein